MKIQEESGSRINRILSEPLAIIVAAIIGGVIAPTIAGIFYVRASERPVEMIISATQTAESKLIETVVVTFPAQIEADPVATPTFFTTPETVVPNIPVQTQSVSNQNTNTSPRFFDEPVNGDLTPLQAVIALWFFISLTNVQGFLLLFSRLKELFTISIFYDGPSINIPLYPKKGFRNILISYDNFFSRLLNMSQIEYINKNISNLPSYSPLSFIILYPVFLLLFIFYFLVFILRVFGLVVLVDFDFLYRSILGYSYIANFFLFTPIIVINKFFSSIIRTINSVS